MKGVPDFRSDWALFLDADGTLLELVDDPSAVELDPEVLESLARIDRESGGAIALVSGRPLEQIDRIFAPLRFPAAGLHGYERRNRSGRVTRSDLDPGALAPVRARFERFVAEHPGSLLEDKILSLALHYRRAPEAAGDAGTLARGLAAALPGGFRLQPGKMVLEVKPGGATKGTAIAEFMAEAPFRGRVPVFVGDDATDEDGFRFVNERFGHSIKVGRGTTDAKHRLQNVEAVKDWIRRYRDFLTEERT
jgi:trehalose 6-phosphate phosphatase